MEFLPNDSLIPRDQVRSQVNNFLFLCVFDLPALQGSNLLPPHFNPDFSFSTTSEIAEPSISGPIHLICGRDTAMMSPENRYFLFNKERARFLLVCHPRHHTLWLPDMFVKTIMNFVLISQLRAVIQARIIKCLFITRDTFQYFYVE